MTQLRFDEFTKAYRAAHSDELDAQPLLRRIHGTIHQRDERRSRRRWVTWLGSMGITATLGATLAYAAPFGRSWADWVTEVATTSLPTQFDGAPGTAGASAALPSVTAIAPPGVPRASLVPVEGSMAERAVAEEPAAAERAVTDERAVAREPSVAAQQPSVAAQPSPRSPSSVRRSTTGRAMAPVGNPPVGSEQPTDVQSLYGEAQRLQFVERDFVAAVLAWDRYLDETHDAVLRPSAEYHRAVCLVHLKRYEAARVELTRLIGPDASPAYRSRAATLLQSLADAWQ